MSSVILPDQGMNHMVTGSGFKDTQSIDRMILNKDAPIVDSFSEFETIVRDEI